MEGKHWQFRFLGQVSGCLSGLIVQSSQEARQDPFIYDVHKNLGNMKAQDKVPTLKAATVHCVDKAKAPEYVHKRE